MSFRNSAVIVTVGLILGSYLWFPRRETSPAPSAAQISRALRAMPSRNLKVQPTRIPEPLPPVQKIEPSPGKEEQCWTKIKAQTENYAEFKHRLNENLKDVVEPWFYLPDTPEPKAPKATAPNLFYLGLAKAGLLEGKSAVQRSDKQALTYLFQSYQMDDRNSAPLLYGAYVAARMGDHSRSKMFLTLLRMRGDKFDTYLTQVVRGIYSAVDNSADYLIGATLWFKLPIPNYNEIKPWLKAPHFNKFARQMLRQGLSRPDPEDGLDYIPVEYAVGWSALGDLRYPSVKEIWERIPPQDSSEITLAIEDNCDLQSLDPFVAQLKRKLSRR